MENNDYFTRQQLSRDKAIENITGVSKTYFDEVSLACSKIADFRNTLMGNFDFLHELQKSGFFDEGSTSERINHCFCLDAVRCYEGMGIPINSDTKEIYGLFLFASAILGDKDSQITYDALIKVEPVINQQISYFVLLKDFGEVYGTQNNLLVSLLLKENSELFRQYHVLLYRWASLVAKADGVITEKEQSWLQTLMSHQTNTTKPINAQDKGDTIVNEVTLPHTIAPLDELRSMIGLSSVKHEVETLYNFVKVQQQRESMGLKTSSISLHCVFTGNPGTGKTTVARIVAQLYKELGVLKKGHLVETDRSGLVAEYVGQTAVKTNRVIDSALDGVLFIDEAYALSEGGNQDFGKEAISTLLKRMEDDRDHLVVILAGYSENIQHFLESNPGLQSRFNKYIHFPDYSEEELYEIFLLNLKKYEYSMTPEAQDKLRSIIKEEVEKADSKFGNGRYVRNLFEKTIEHQANRLASVANITPEVLSTITENDF